MAAYAALVSLMHVLENIQHPARDWICLDRKQIQSLQQTVCSLIDFLEDFSHRRSKIETDGLESEMAAASYSAEDIIESFVVDQILAPSPDRLKEVLPRFSQDIQKVIEEMESIEKKVMKIKAMMGVMKDQPHESYLPAAAGSSRSAPSSENTVVGFGEHMEQIIDRLTGQESKLQMIPIVGMGGIGKTTLARNIYDHKVIMQYFDIRAWVTISQEYTVREVLLALLHEVDKKKQENNENQAALKDEISKMNDEQIGEQLHKTLFGRRYLIVMDDMWSIEALDKARKFFPDNTNGSRIMITTRLSIVADCFGSSHKMDFLDEDKSWNLFCDVVFPQGGCSIKFEKIGKKIVKGCRGLPLAIVVIGGLLAKSNRTLEYWEYAAENLNSVINSGSDDHCLQMLSLSYSHLPIHLKPCFLFMAIFPEDCEIRVSKLIKLWVAEGFLKSIRAKSLEVIANEYLNDLIDRNLILVSKRGTTGKIKSCIVHDLLRDLCLKEAHRANFLCVLSRSSNHIPPNVESKCRFSVHQSSRKSLNHTKFFDDALQSASLACTLVCDSEFDIQQLFPRLRLLRVLDVFENYSPQEIMELVNLRYIALADNRHRTRVLTSSISLFWNLQTLNGGPGWFYESNDAIGLSEIWEMPQLRHVNFHKLEFSDPPHPQIARQHSYILENLQTISTIRNFRCTEEVFKRVPNLKKMKINYSVHLDVVGWPYYCLNNLVHLRKLESLTCKAIVSIRMSAGNIAFPTSLKSLTLCGCGLPWKDMTIVGSLPNLEKLKLEDKAFVGLEWNPIEGEFVLLKFLLIGWTDLMYWIADSTHFPSLEHLILKYSNLEEIPFGLAEVPMLRYIQLIDSDFVVPSAKQILEERESLGYEGLQVEVRNNNRSVFLSASEYSNEVDIER